MLGSISGAMKTRSWRVRAALVWTVLPRGGGTHAGDSSGLCSPLTRTVCDPCWACRGECACASYVLLSLSESPRVSLEPTESRGLRGAAVHSPGGVPCNYLRGEDSLNSHEEIRVLEGITKSRAAKFQIDYPEKILITTGGSSVRRGC